MLREVFGPSARNRRLENIAWATSGTFSLPDYRLEVGMNPEGLATEHLEMSFMVFQQVLRWF